MIRSYIEASHVSLKTEDHLWPLKVIVSNALKLLQMSSLIWCHAGHRFITFKIYVLTCIKHIIYIYAATFKSRKIYNE